MLLFSLYSGLSFFLLRSQLLIILFSLYMISQFALVVSKILPFYLAFSSLTNVSLHLSYSKCIELVESIKLMFFIEVGKFPAVILFFFSWSLFFCFPGNPIILMLKCLLCPTGLWASSFFIILLFFCSSDWTISIDWFSSSLILLSQIFCWYHHSFQL